MTLAYSLETALTKFCAWFSSDARNSSTPPCSVSRKPAAWGVQVRLGAQRLLVGLALPVRGTQPLAVAVERVAQLLVHGLEVRAQRGGDVGDLRLHAAGCVRRLATRVGRAAAGVHHHPGCTLHIADVPADPCSCHVADPSVVPVGNEDGRAWRQAESIEKL